MIIDHHIYSIQPSSTAWTCWWTSKPWLWSKSLACSWYCHHCHHNHNHKHHHRPNPLLAPGIIAIVNSDGDADLASAFSILPWRYDEEYKVSRHQHHHHYFRRHHHHDHYHDHRPITWLGQSSQKSVKISPFKHLMTFAHGSNTNWGALFASCSSIIRELLIAYCWF